MLTGKDMVSAYNGIIAVLIALGLLVLPNRKYMKNKTESILFSLLCTSTLVAALSTIACSVIRSQNLSFGYAGELFSLTVLDIAIVFMVYQWMLYVDFRLYESRDQLTRRYRWMIIPLAVILLLLIVNIFTGILFSVQQDLTRTTTVLYYLMAVVESIYILLSVVLIIKYDKSNPGKRIFNILPPLVFMAGGSLVDIFTDYSAVALGFAVGLLLLYYSMIKGWQYKDDESGYYNNAYLKGILSGESRDADGIHGVIIFEVKGDEKGFEEILKNEMPPDGIIIHDRKKRFILFTGSGNTGDLKFLVSMVEDAAAEDMGEGISLSVKCDTRKNGEDAKTFLGRVMESAAD